MSELNVFILKLLCYFLLAVCISGLIFVWSIFFISITAPFSILGGLIKKKGKADSSKATGRGE